MIARRKSVVNFVLVLNRKYILLGIERIHEFLNDSRTFNGKKASITSPLSADERMYCDDHSVTEVSRGHFTIPR